MKLRISTLPEDKPVKITVELPADVYRDLVAYAELIAPSRNQQGGDVTRLLVAMVKRFMETDRAFTKSKARHMSDKSENHK